MDRIGTMTALHAMGLETATATAGQDWQDGQDWEDDCLGVERVSPGA